MENIEIWKPIPWTDGKYCISNLGNVKSLERTYKSGKFFRETLKPESILKKKLEKNGYWSVVMSLGSRGNRKTVKIHRLIAEAFIPNPDNKPQVNHINGIKTDNRIENLEWVTPKENITHAISMGLRSSVGSKNVKAKCTEEDVREIRRLFANGMSNREINKIYPFLAYISLSQITNGRTWRHV